MAPDLHLAVVPEQLELAPRRTTCLACGKPLQAHNATGVCYLCQQANRSARTCACGCGRPICRRNHSGLARACLLRAIAATVAGVQRNQRHQEHLELGARRRRR